MLLLSSSNQKLPQHFRKVRFIANKKNLTKYPEKTSFTFLTIKKNLSHEIGLYTIKPFQSKINLNPLIPSPTRKTELMNFNGSVNFYGEITDKILLIRSLCMIYSCKTLNFSGIKNEKRCFNNLKHLSQMILLRLYVAQTIRSLIL